MFVKKNCVFVPFIPNKKNAAKDYPTDNTKLVIKSKNASITITDDGEKSSITLGAQAIEVSAPEGINITGDMNVKGEVTANGIPLSAHIHTSAAPGSPTTGPAPMPQPEQGV
jgi:phage baseplate assembly protein gpV